SRRRLVRRRGTCTGCRRQRVVAGLEGDSPAEARRTRRAPSAAAAPSRAWRGRSPARASAPQCRRAWSASPRSPWSSGRRSAASRATVRPGRPAVDQPVRRVLPGGARSVPRRRRASAQRALGPPETRQAAPRGRRRQGPRQAEPRALGRETVAPSSDGTTVGPGGTVPLRAPAGLVRSAGGIIPATGLAARGHCVASLPVVAHRLLGHHRRGGVGVLLLLLAPKELVEESHVVSFVEGGETSI